jgi:hypothetical protein
MHQNSKAAVNEELERITKEAMMTYFRILSQHFPGSVTLTDLSQCLGFNLYKI